MFMNVCQVRDIRPIFFDTYPLRKSLLHKNHIPFFKEAKRLLRDGGLFTYYTDEEHHIGPQHQEILLEQFAELSIQQVRVEPPVSCEYWRGDRMIVIVAKKKDAH